MLLGLGEVEPVNRKDAVLIAREAFLWAINYNAPKVLEDLSNEPLDIFIAAGNEEVIKRMLRRWSKTWNLESEWLIEESYRTLEMWALFKHLVRSPLKNVRKKYQVWSPLGGGELWHPSVELVPPRGLIHWHPEHTPRNKYVAYARRKIKKYIKSDPIFVCLSLRTREAVIDELMF